MTSQQATGEAGARYWIPHHLRVAVTPTGVVLLDLKRDRYFALDETETRELAVLAGNWAEVSNEAQTLGSIERDTAANRGPAFVRAGLLTPEPQQATFNTTPVDVSAQLTSIGHQGEIATSIRLHHILAFIGACRWAKKVMRSRSLYSVACELSAAKTNANSSLDVRRTNELVFIFRRLRPYAFEAKDQCLFHALALMHFLMRYGSRPSWVIGVCARPWAAHSWLQLDNCILDASPEDVCTFTPILAV